MKKITLDEAIQDICDVLNGSDADYIANIYGIVVGNNPETDDSEPDYIEIDAES